MEPKEKLVDSNLIPKTLSGLISAYENLEKKSNNLKLLITTLTRKLLQDAGNNNNSSKEQEKNEFMACVSHQISLEYNLAILKENIKHLENIAQNEKDNAKEMDFNNENYINIKGDNNNSIKSKYINFF